MATNGIMERTRRRLKLSAKFAAGFILFGCVTAVVLIFAAPGAATLTLFAAVAWTLLVLAGTAASLALFAVYDAGAAALASGHLGSRIAGLEGAAAVASARLESRIAELEKELADRKSRLDQMVNQYTTLRTGLLDQIKIDSRRTEARLETLGDELRKLSQSIEAVAAEQRRIRHATNAARLEAEQPSVQQASDA